MRRYVVTLVEKVVDVPSFMQMMVFGSPEKLIMQRVSMSFRGVFSSCRDKTVFPRIGVAAVARKRRLVERMAIFRAEELEVTDGEKME